MFDTIIGVLGFLVGVIGVMLTIKSNQKEKKLKSISWSEILNATKLFYTSLKKKNFKPDLIISPGPKGAIVGQLVKDYYNDNILQIVGTLQEVGSQKFELENSYSFGTTKWDIYFPSTLVELQEKDKLKVLIVDDFVSSGDFIYYMKQNLVSLGYKADNITVCALAVTSVAFSSNKKPDYYWKKVDNDNFIFPWGKAK